MIKIAKYTNDITMKELMYCNGDARLILSKLNELNLYGCDFTLEEIGDILNITRERVRQIETSAIKKIKNPKIGRNMKKYLEM